jgi:hypothetical protein
VVIGLAVGLAVLLEKLPIEELATSLASKVLWVPAASKRGDVLPGQRLPTPGAARAEPFVIARLVVRLPLALKERSTQFLPAPSAHEAGGVPLRAECLYIFPNDGFVARCAGYHDILDSQFNLADIRVTTVRRPSSM